MLLALVLVAGGIGTFGLSRFLQALSSGGITHEIMRELAPVDRIEASPGDLRGYNVVIITTDTTRADHVGCYGNRSVETPVIDSLAREGILCAQTVTPSPSTLPAHSSLLTGLYPYRHGARANGTFRLEDQVNTLAERLKERGYRTGAVISAFVLDSRFGVDQGFDYYNDDLTKGMQYSRHMFRERAAELTNEPATQWLRENAQGPFFLWVHYFDPHAVYLAPEPFRSRYAYDPYDGEIAYVDSQIGVLLGQLKDLGVRDKTLVVYTADHGEGLGEHGEQTHTLLVHDATLHVPLIFHAPSRLPKGKVIHRQTCLVDVMPTVLSLLGEPVTDKLDGLDLCVVPKTKTRPVLIETIASMTLHGWAPLVGVRRDDYKYILAPTAELYDLKNDPRELENLHAADSQVVRDLSAHLAAWLGDDPYLAARRAVDLSNLGVDEDALEHLGALGYVATGRAQLDESVPLPDPKEMIGHWETVQNAINLQAQGKAKEALPILKKCVANVEGDIFARTVLAGIYRQMGELDKAFEEYRRAAELEPQDEHIRLGIAAVHVARQQYGEAEQQIAEALKIESECAQAYSLHGQIAQYRGMEQEALTFYLKAIEMDPGSVGAGAYNQIGFLHLYAGRRDEAREAFRSALAIDALDATAHDGLANILKLEGKVAQAMAELELALRFDPNQPRALSTLASLISQRGDQEKSLKLCQRAVEVAPRFAPALNNLGLIYRRRNNLQLAEKYYLEAIKIEPRLDAAHVNLAQLYTRQGKRDKALEEFRRAVAVNPRNPNPIALANLGVYHFNKQEPAAALVYYQRALKVDPDYALVHKYIASIYSLKDWDRPDLVAYHVGRSLDLDPRQPEADQMRDLVKRAEVAAASRAAAAGPPSSVDAPAAAAGSTGSAGSPSPSSHE